MRRSSFHAVQQLGAGPGVFPWICGAALVAHLAGCGGSNPAPVEAMTAAPVRSTPAPSVAQESRSLSQHKSEPVEKTAERQTRALIAKLTTPGLDPREWDAAHQELIGLGPSAAQALATIVRTGSDIEREQAATALVLLGLDAEPAVEALQAALSDDSEFVRANAAAALVQFPDHASSAVPTLIALLRSGDPHMRQLAATNLNTLGAGAQSHVSELTDILEKETTPETLVPVVQLLGRIGRPAEGAVPQLKQIQFEQPGELAAAADAAIQAITSTNAAEASASPPETTE